MTLLLREVLRFVVGALAWTAVMAAVSLAAATPFVAASPSHSHRRIFWFAVLGAIALPALAVRFSAPLAWAPAIGHRPLPIVWSAVGALAAASVAVASDRTGRPV